MQPTRWAAPADVWRRARAGKPLGVENQEQTTQNDAGAEESGQMRRTTEQGDELTEEHSLAMREHRAYVPYTRPRQPAQDPPAE